jgi:two-component system cell cycle response regulator DivK
MKERILVVEDNPLNLELLRDWLEMDGYEVLTATSLIAGFAVLESQQPNVVLLDVQLGADDGLTLASWIRQQPALCQIPIIAVTAQAMASERQRILESGCNSVVPKPLNFKLLKDQLQLWLGRPAGLQENSAPVKK